MNLPMPREPAAPDSRRDAIEATIRDAHARGAFDEAATALLESYGGEIGGYLAATLRHEDDAAEAFSRFQEDLWRGLPAFDFRASARTWAYVLARNAAHHLRRAPHRRREMPNVLFDTEAQERLHGRLVAEVRASTARFLKTEVKDRVRALREQLTDDERELLILRIDRGLDWSELAAVLSSDAESTGVDEKERARDAAKYRKRFARTKERLRALASAEGLLP